MTSESTAPKPSLVQICVPSRSDWKAEFGISLVRVIAYCLSQGNILPYPQLASGSVIAELRNSLVQRALDTPETTHVSFIDDDQMFPADTIPRLIAHDLPIVGANIVRKESNPRTNSRELAPEGFDQKLANVCWTLPHSTGVQEVDYVGTGLILIKREVFEAMGKPWYFYDLKGEVGEDVSFCHKARELGYSTHIDHDLSKEVKHCGTFYWGMEHTDPWRYEMSKKDGNK